MDAAAKEALCGGWSGSAESESGKIDLLPEETFWEDDL
tara:strand:+ start:3086 stop:3199 length:114 start_codon:yes stop_codon:yes gene_type:complete